jgi:hypothetical protein
MAGNCRVIHCPILKNLENNVPETGSVLSPDEREVPSLLGQSELLPSTNGPDGADMAGLPHLT